MKSRRLIIFVLPVLFCLLTLVSCPGGKIRNYLDWYASYADGEFGVRGLTARPLDGSVRLDWSSIDGDRHRLAVYDENGNLVGTPLEYPAGGGSGFNFTGLTNFTRYSFVFTPVDPDTGLDGFPFRIYATPGVIFVDQSRPAGGLGNDWSTASNNLQGAIDEASAMFALTPSPMQVRVALGTYIPSSAGGSPPADNTACYFALKSNVQVVGGYNPATNQKTGRTVLSGDHGAGIKSLRVVYGSGITNAVLEGFVVRDGASSTNSGCGVTFTMCTGTINITDCEIRDNASSYSTGNGGGVALNQCSNVYVFTDCVFSNNYAAYNGGAVGQNSATGGSVTFQRCVFNDNSVLVGISHSGGAVYMTYPVVFLNSQFSRNSAVQGGAVFVSGASSRNFSNCVFTGNHSTSNGGAVYASCGVTLNGCTFTDNYSSGASGGASYITSSSSITVVANGGTYSGNHAEANNGGAFYLDGNCTSTFSGLVFSRNHATQGGAIQSMGSLTLNSCNFTDNYAANRGGAVNALSAFSMNGGTCIGNWAMSSGGVLYFDNALGSCSVSNAVFERNGMENPDVQGTAASKTQNGGALYLANYNAATIQRCVFSLNKVTIMGGAINNYNYQSGKTIALSHCVFYNNHSGTYTYAGPDIYSYVNANTNAMTAAFCSFVSSGETSTTPQPRKVYFDGNTTSNQIFAGCLFYSDNANHRFIHRSGTIGTHYYMSCLSNYAFDIASFAVVGEATCRTSSSPFLLSPNNSKGPDGIWMTADDGLRLNGSGVPAAADYIPYQENSPVVINYYDRGNDILNAVRGVNGASTGWDPGAYAY